MVKVLKYSEIHVQSLQGLITVILSGDQQKVFFKCSEGIMYYMFYMANINKTYRPNVRLLDILMHYNSNII